MANYNAFFNQFPQLEGTDLGNHVIQIAKQYQVTFNQIEILMRIFGRLTVVARALGATHNFSLQNEKFKRLKFLDLACGSEAYSPISLVQQLGPNEINDPEVAEIRRYISENMKNVMAPWLCRSMAKLGADVIGVDILPPHSVTRVKKGRVKKEFFSEVEWKFIQRNLTQDGSLDPSTFPNNSFDVITSFNFINNESFDGSVMNEPAIEIMRLHDPIKYEHIVQEIRTSAIRILKKGGIAIIGGEYIKK